MHGVSSDQVDRYLANVCPTPEGSDSATRAKWYDWQPPEQYGEVPELTPDGQHQQQEGYTFLKPSVPEALPPPPLPCLSISPSNRTTTVQQKPYSETSPGAATMTQTPSSRASMHEEKTASSEGEAGHQEADDWEIDDREPNDRCQQPEEVGHGVDGPDALDRDTTCLSSTQLLPPVSDCFCPAESPAPPLGRAETLETSCDEAATILVTMHGQADADARVALGCRGPSSCSVNNIKIFQLMDRLG